MNNIKVVIFGTEHGTPEEKDVIMQLENIVSKYKEIVWLCEGNPGMKPCESLKDITLHVLTDALIVNMFIHTIDKAHNKETLYRSGLFVRRVIELLTTVRLFADDEVLRLFSIKGEYIKTISILKYDFLTKDILDQAKTLINMIPPLELGKDMKDICGKIVNLCIDRKYVNDNYVHCVRRFYETGEECEDVVLSGYVLVYSKLDNSL